MYDLNSVSISGRFTDEVKTVATKNGNTAVFGTIAVRTHAPRAQIKKEDTSTWTVPVYIDFSAFGRIAARLVKAGKKSGLKGKHVILTGSLTIRTNKDESKSVTYKNASVRVRDFVIDGYPKKAGEGAETPEEFPPEPEIPDEEE